MKESGGKKEDKGLQARIEKIYPKPDYHINIRVSELDKSQLKAPKEH